MRTAAARRRTEPDSGFSLIEVVVALFLLGIVAAAALAFFVRAMQNTNHMQRSQASVAVANQAMELARSVSAREVDTANHVSGLLIGRSSGDTDLAWAAYPSDVTLMNKVSDAWAASRPVLDASTGRRAVVPVVTTTRVGGVDYKVTTLIGTCYRPKAASASEQNCVKTGTTSDVLMYRVTVVVSVKGSKTGECTTTAACEYRTSTLVDPTLDANWNLTAKPVAYDDAISSVAGTTSALPTNVLANDVMGTVTANPTTITSGPDFGTATVTTSGASMGYITYVPGNSSGTTQLTYKLKDAAGRQSNEATVMITVLPKATADTATAFAGGADVDIDVLANDLGTGLTIVKTSGSATVVGGKLRFTPPATAGTVTLQYKAVDSSTLESSVVNVVVTVQTPVTPNGGTPSITLPYSATATAANLDILNKTSNASNYTIALGTTLPSQGSVTLNPAKTVATFNQVAGQPVGLYTFTFTITNPTGPKTGPTGTYTIAIVPAAVADSTVSVKDNATPAATSVVSNDLPSSSGWSGKYKIVVVNASSNANCGSASVVDANAGTVKFTPKSTSITTSCSFTYDYRFESSSGPSYVSNTVTNTVTVLP